MLNRKTGATTKQFFSLPFDSSYRRRCRRCRTTPTGDKRLLLHDFFLPFPLISPPTVVVVFTPLVVIFFPYQLLVSVVSIIDITSLFFF